MGGVKAVLKEGDSLATATVSAIIEALFMAIAALLVTIISATIGVMEINFSPMIISLQIIVIMGSLIGIHPNIMNPILSKLAKGKGSNKVTKLTKYPLLPLGGELIFLLLKGCGFIVLIIPFITLKLTLIPPILTAFSFAWLLGLVVPGAPGGLGIFEATVIATLDATVFPQEIILIVVAFSRISSTLAEVITAYGAFLITDE